jgi:hypothetical protein
MKPRSTKKHRFIGLRLGGARNPNTCISVIDYYKDHGRIFLVDILSKLKKEKKEDLDDVLVEILSNLKDKSTFSFIATNAPLSLPPCYECKLKKCTGFKTCKKTKLIKFKKKAKELNEKIIVKPYTQRLEDIILKLNGANAFSHETMGSNLSPLTSRMIYIKKRLSGFKIKETNIKLSFLNILKALNMNEDYLKRYTDLFSGQKIRKTFLKKIEKNKNIFIYNSDLKELIKNVKTFEAFILAFTAYLDFVGKTKKIDSKTLIIPKVSKL